MDSSQANAVPPTSGTDDGYKVSVLHVDDNLGIASTSNVGKIVIQQSATEAPTSQGPNVSKSGHKDASMQKIIQ